MSQGTTTKVRRRVLLVDDDDALREVVAFQLEEQGWLVRTANGAAAALATFETGAFDAVVTDLRMPGVDGLSLLQTIRERDPLVSVLIVTAHSSVDAAMAAVRAGAYDFLVKPVARETLRLKVERAMEQSALLRERRTLQRRLEASAARPLLYESEPMRRMMGTAERVAGSELPLLLQGESGTGKELVARAIHRASKRAAGPFVAVNCAAIPGELLEAELFGHDRGAYTGAERAREGRFRAADGGTILLDEVGDLPLLLQPKLLRVLQEEVVEPVGASRPVPVDVRFLAATHRDLHAAVREGRFREDLYYRLAGIVLRVPPLRERPEDVEPLFTHFFEQEAARAGRDLRIGAGVGAVLRARSWPGNVRELEHLARRMALLCSGPDLRPDEVEGDHDGRGDGGALRIDTRARPYAVTLPPEPFHLPDVEDAIVRAALDHHGGNQSAAARALGVPRHVLTYKLEKWGKGEG